MNETISLTLTKTECNELANVIDLAVKAGGVMTAKIAMKFIERIESELSKPSSEPEKPNA